MNMMIQTRTGNPIVDAVATLNITGNVIPESWYHTIVNEKGKVNCLAIHILADIVYWYRPTENRDPNRVTIDEHEHAIYEELFHECLEKQHARNNAARHPERNKSVDDLLNHKNYCQEETIFQIGSLRDV